MIPYGTFLQIRSQVLAYHRAVIDGGRPLRLLVGILNVLGSYNLPHELEARIEHEIMAVHYAAYENRPIPTPRIPVSYVA